MIINANALHIPLADETVQCVVTSPPYWGLRDYGTAKWDGGDPECDHTKNRTAGIQSSTLGGGKSTTNHQEEASYRDVCGKCGAYRLDAQLGLEPTPEEYVANMVAVFREVRRVMRKDGVCWLNLGDSYAGSVPFTTNEKALKGKQGTNRGTHGNGTKPDWGTLKPKDLVGIPWRVAFALQGFALISIDQIASLCKAIDSRDFAALDWFRAGFRLWEELAGMGWFWNRSDIIWHKPNPMPESVTDRPTKAHEYIFLLTKRANYYYDAEAVREALSPTTQADPRMRDMGRVYDGKGRGAYGEEGKANGSMQAWSLNPSGRNRRTVWTIPTSPYSGSHFATFPPDLVRPCILAGSSPRACEHCGAPWERVVERVGYRDTHGVNNIADEMHAHEPIRKNGTRHGTTSVLTTGKVSVDTTTGWRATCTCDNQGTGRSIVLDPFAGTFTVGMVAAEYGRRAVGIELNPEYIKLAQKRTRQAQSQGVMPL